MQTALRGRIYPAVERAETSPAPSGCCMPKASSLYLEFLATQTITKPLKHKALAADKQGAVVDELSICAPRPPSEEWRSGDSSGRRDK
jgi:hypothetical protein